MQSPAHLTPGMEIVTREIPCRHIMRFFARWRPTCLAHIIRTAKEIAGEIQLIENPAPCQSDIALLFSGTFFIVLSVPGFLGTSTPRICPREQEPVDPLRSAMRAVGLLLPVRKMSTRMYCTDLCEALELQTDSDKYSLSPPGRREVGRLLWRSEGRMSVLRRRLFRGISSEA